MYVHRIGDVIKQFKSCGTSEQQQLRGVSSVNGMRISHSDGNEPTCHKQKEK